MHLLGENVASHCHLWPNNQMRIPLFYRINIFGMILIELPLAYDHVRILVLGCTQIKWLNAGIYLFHIHHMMSVLNSISNFVRIKIKQSIRGENDGIFASCCIAMATNARTIEYAAQAKHTLDWRLYVFCGQQMKKVLMKICMEMHFE